MTSCLPRRVPAPLHSAMRVRSVARFALLSTCVAAAFVPAFAPARDWTSPVAAAPKDILPEQRRPATPGWAGTLWPGVGHGAPAAPSAADCRRAPATFDVPGYEAPAERRTGRPEGAPAGAVSLAARPAPAVEPPPADAAAARRDSGTGAAASERSRIAAARSESMMAPHERHVAAVPRPQPIRSESARPADEPVSAGMVDDNADFGEYVAYRQRWPQLARRELDLSSRVLLDVRDSTGRAVPDAQVRVRSSGRELSIWARTDAGGRVWLAAQPDAGAPAGRPLEVEVTKGGDSTRVLWTPGQKDALQARLAAPGNEQARLDLVFLVDATGSMGDEIDKLKRSMRAVAEQIAQLPTRPDLCFGLVAYRDRGDAFFVRGADLTHDLPAFQGVLEGLHAGGGGDYPEAMNEALHTAVHRISWRGEGTARMVVLVADAPPHLDYAGPQYDQDLRAAKARGIKIFSVGASGLDPQGEYIQRQLAQFTGGRFVFLTYAQAARPSSGPGRETVHDVRNYSVETLDRLLVRLVGDELARWPQALP